VGGKTTLQTSDYAIASVGHADPLLGYGSFTYGYAAAAGAPYYALDFVPRNNSNTTSVNLARLQIAKVAGENSSTMQFETANAGARDVRMFIDKSGNVGIGTTSPQGKLHVIGNCVTGDTLLPIRRKKKSKIKNQKSKITGTGPDPLPRLADVEGKIPADVFYEYEYLLCRIDEVLPGDEVLSLNEATEALEYARINKLMNMGHQEVYELTTKSGRKIRTTAEHPYLTLTN
jgi:hypothetical protein